MRIELRNDSVVLDGYVNIPLRESRLLPSPKGQFVEEILPRTFERALQKTDSVDLLFNHDKNRRLGSTKDGNLELYEDNVGLRAIATVSDPEVIKKAKSGELRGWSFGFSVLKDSWSTREDGVQKRTVEDIELFEISILDRTPAYVATSIEARGEENAILTETRSEDFKAKIEDHSEKSEDSSGENTNPNIQEEKRVKPENHYYENLEKELSFLKIKGGTK